MVSIYFVRHGQTEQSRSNAFCGMIDPPLNQTGLKMAEALGQRLARETWQAIYCSPLLRARQTVAPAAALIGREVVIEDGLREIAYGSWEGRKEDELEASDPERFAAWLAHPARVAPPGGETAIDIAKRAVPVIDSIVGRHASGNLLVMSHKATLRVILCALLGIDLDLFRARIGQRVAAITIVDFKKTGPLLRVLNDSSHLPPELLIGDGS